MDIIFLVNSDCFSPIFCAQYSSCMKKATIFSFYCALGFSFGTVMTPHTRLWIIFQVSAKLCDVEREARLYAKTSKNCKTNKRTLIRVLVTKLMKPSLVLSVTVPLICQCHLLMDSLLEPKYVQFCTHFMSYPLYRAI